MDSRGGRKTAVRLNGFGGEFHSWRAISGGRPRRSSKTEVQKMLQSVAGGTGPTAFLRVVIAAAFAAMALPAIADPVYFPGDQWERRAPAVAGFDPAALEEAIRYAQQNEAQWGDIDRVADYVQDGGFDDSHNRKVTWHMLLNQTS